MSLSIGRESGRPARFYNRCSKTNHAVPVQILEKTGLKRLHSCISSSRHTPPLPPVVPTLSLHDALPIFSPGELPGHLIASRNRFGPDRLPTAKLVRKHVI